LYNRTVFSGSKTCGTQTIDNGTKQTGHCLQCCDVHRPTNSVPPFSFVEEGVGLVRLVSVS